MKRFAFLFPLLMVCLFVNTYARAEGGGIFKGESAYGWLYFPDPVTQSSETLDVWVNEQGYAVKTTRQLFLGLIWTIMGPNWELVQEERYYCEVDSAVLEIGQAGASIGPVTLSGDNCTVSGYSESRGYYVPSSTTLLVQWFDPDETGVSTTVNRTVNTVTNEVSSDTYKFGYGAAATVVLVKDLSAYTLHPAGGYSFAMGR